MKADLILKSTSIFTGMYCPDNHVKCIAISDNTILYAGPYPVPEELITPKSKVIDLGDRTIMPGFVDNHVHFLLGATILSEYCCSELVNSTSEAECIEMLKKFYLKYPDSDKIIGFGWFPANWNTAQLPTRKSLDEAFPNIPVYLLAADCHTFWLNGKALEVCGITNTTPYSFGYIGLDENNEPNGILSEIELAAYGYREFFNFEAKKAAKINKNFLNELARMGITSITNVAECTTINKEPPELKCFKELEDSGKLTVRMNIYPSLGITEDLTLQKYLRNKYNGHLITIAGLKQFFDGVTSTYTAALCHPYTDNPNTAGTLLYPESTYESAIRSAIDNGFGIKLHCIGDYAVKTGLDIFQRAKEMLPSYENNRYSIEHIETIDPVDIPRFNQLNITASIQPRHLILDAFEKLSRVGSERCKAEWPIKSFLDSGANISFGTDAPVCPLEPFHNIYAAITRCDYNGNESSVNMDQTISLCDAIKAYTLGGAYSNGLENVLGTLEPGKLADITVADRNIFNIDAKELLSCNISLTIVDGKIVYKNL